MGSLEALSDYQNTNAPTEWEEPIGFDNIQLPEFDTSIFPDWARDYIDAVSESIQVSPGAPAMSCLSVLSSIMSGKFVIQPSPDWREELALYTVVSMSSSERKSPVNKTMVQPLYHHEKEKSEKLQPEITEQATWLKAQEKRLNELYNKYGKKKDPEVYEEIQSIEQEIESTEIITKPRLVTSDATPEALAALMSKNNEKMAILTSEGKELFDMMAGKYSQKDMSNIDFYLKCYDGEQTSIDRKGGEPLLLESPTMTIGLFVQPTVIQGIGTEFQDRGLMPRFLFSFPSSWAGSRNLRPKPIPDIVKFNFENIAEKLLEYESDHEILTLEEEAEQLFIHYRAYTEDMYKEEYSERFKSWLGKLDGKLARIAAILHIAKYAGENDIPKQIDIDTLQDATSLRNYFIEHAKKAYGDMGISGNNEDAKYLLDKLIKKNEEEISQRDLLRMARRFKTITELKTALIVLEERGFVKVNNWDDKQIFVNPQILSTKTT